MVVDKGPGSPAGRLVLVCTTTKGILPTTETLRGTVCAETIRTSHHSESLQLLQVSLRCRHGALPVAWVACPRMQLLAVPASVVLGPCTVLSGLSGRPRPHWDPRGPR